MREQMSKAFFITEDRYGGLFFKNLIRILYDKGYINRRYRVNFANAPANCNVKLESIIKVQMSMSSYDIIFLVNDGDCRPDQKRKIFQIHIRRACNYVDCSKLCSIVFHSEIEEWICIGMGFKNNWGCKPSKFLERKLNYRKNQLPDYATKINLPRLLKNSSTFREFLNCLK